MGGAHYILVGEHHYEAAAGSKARLADLIRSERGSYVLYVEQTPRDLAFELEEYVGLDSVRGPAPTRDSLLQLLESEEAIFFAPRPEDLRDGMMYDPGDIAQLVHLVRFCGSAAMGCADAVLQTLTSLASTTLTNSLTMARNMEARGSVDSRLVPVIKQKLEAVLTKVKDRFNSQAFPFPAARLVFDRIRGATDEYKDSVEEAVWSPHIVSDAVVATELVRQAASSVVVCGRAHAHALEDLLRALQT